MQDPFTVEDADIEALHLANESKQRRVIGSTVSDIINVGNPRVAVLGFVDSV